MCVHHNISARKLGCSCIGMLDRRMQKTWLSADVVIDVVFLMDACLLLVAAYCQDQQINASTQLDNQLAATPVAAPAASRAPNSPQASLGHLRQGSVTGN